MDLDFENIDYSIEELAKALKLSDEQFEPFRHYVFTALKQMEKSLFDISNLSDPHIAILNQTATKSS